MRLAISRPVAHGVVRPIAGIRPLMTAIMQVLGTEGRTIDRANGTLINGRSSVATVEDFEGNILDCLANEIRYKYGRRVDHGDATIYNAGVAGIEYFNDDGLGNTLAIPMRVLDEGAGENLCPDNGNATLWYATGSPVATDSGLSWSGMKKVLIESSGGAWNRVRSALMTSVTAGDIITATYWYEASDSGRVRVTIRDSIPVTETIINGVIGSLSISASAAGVAEILSDDVVFGLIRKVVIRFTAGTTNTDTRFAIGPDSSVVGEGVYIYGSQVAASKYPQSLIRTTGAAASRSADSLNLPVLEGTNFVNAGGALVFDVTFGYDEADVSDAGLLGLRSSAYSLLYASSANGAVSYDGSGNVVSGAIGFVTGDRVKISVTWSAAENLFSISFSTDGGATQSAWAQAAYDGAFAIAALYEFFKNNPFGNELHEATVYKSRAGATLAEIQTAVESL